MIKSLILVTVLACSACTSVKTVQHPGSLNSFDNFAYDSLITEQAAINQAKSEISKYPQAKTQLNNVITQYDTTQAAYKVYHLALVAGSSPSNTALQTSINSLITNVATLIKSMIPQAPPVPSTGK